MTTTFRAPAPAPSASLRPLAILGIVIAGFALSPAAALGAVRLLAPASSKATTASTTAASASTTGAQPFALVHVSTTQLVPQQATVARGGTLVLMNMGTDPISLAVNGTKLATTVPADDEVNLALTGVKPGKYTLQVQRPDGRPTALKMPVTVTK